MLLLAIGLLHGFIDGPLSLWWRITQIGAWSLLTNMAYLLFALILDLRRCSEREEIIRDIFFTVCLTLACGVFLFYVLVVLPFTPKFKIDGHCHTTQKSDDCMSLGGIVAMSLVHLVPLMTTVLEMVFVEHRFSFENIKVELSVLSSYVCLFLVWSVLCYELLHASPYYVQDMVGTSVSIVIYVFCILFFLVVFFCVRWMHHKIWPPGTKVHYTDKLIASIEEQWNSIPAAVDFEVQTFTSDIIKPLSSKPMPTVTMDTKAINAADEIGYEVGGGGRRDAKEIEAPFQ